MSNWSAAARRISDRQATFGPHLTRTMRARTLKGCGGFSPRGQELPWCECFRSSSPSLLPACSKGTPASAATETSATPGAQATANQDQAAAAPTAKPVPTELPDPVARVNGETITKADFQRAVQTVEANAGGPVPPDQRDRIYRGVLDQMIGYRLLLRKRRPGNWRSPTASWTSVLVRSNSQFPSEEALQTGAHAAERDPRAAPRQRAQ